MKNLLTTYKLELVVVTGYVFFAVERLLSYLLVNVKPNDDMISTLFAGASSLVPIGSLIMVVASTLLLIKSIKQKNVFAIIASGLTLVVFIRIGFMILMSV